MAEVREFVCIVCPNGCRLRAERGENGAITVSGNTCLRGEKFAIGELTHPMRSLTTTVRTAFPSFPVLPVRTAGEIPKESVREAMRVIASLEVTEPLACGDVVCENLAGTGVSLVATATVAVRETENNPRTTERRA